MSMRHPFVIPPSQQLLPRRASGTERHLTAPETDRRTAPLLFGRSSGYAAHNVHCRNHAMRQFVLIIHEVADYPVWKEVFDNAATMRKSAGECTFQVLACSGDANRIVHFSQWSSLDAARACFESLELVQIRLDAGVKAPEFIYLDEIESGVL
jgi:hypothetical protein